MSVPSVALRVNQVTKAFGAFQVLKDVSFELREQEILGIIGPSGSGKSTLLRCLNLMQPIDSGEIEFPDRFQIKVSADGSPMVNGVPMTDKSVAMSNHAIALRRVIGLVFQNLNLWESRTVLDNLTLAPRVVLGQSANEAEREAARLCNQYGLSDKMSSRAWELSGGQKQRVAILRSLMMGPHILLLDEVTSALDPVLTVDMMRTIRQLRDNGLTMIVITHYIEFASSICDRIMFLSDGRVVQLDTPDVLRDHPATEEVGQFLDVLRTAR